MDKLLTKWFKKWAKKARLKNQSMLEAIDNLENNLSAANLGSNLYKVRVQKANRGKSSGFRTIIVYRKNERAIFLYGFGKNEKENINNIELQYFKKLGSDLLELSQEELKRTIEKEILFDLEVET